MVASRRVAREAHVPAAQLGVVLDDLDVLLGRDRALEVSGDELVRGLDVGIESASVFSCTGPARARARSW